MALMFVSAFALFYTAKANPSFFSRQNNGTTGTTASTSVTYMTPGLATTTYYMDTENNSVDSAIFDAQQTGSSTASVSTIAFEYAMPAAGFDCDTTPTACDWYPDAIMWPSYATTTGQQNINTPNSVSLKFASTTQGGIVGNSVRTNRAIYVPTPTRYVRAVVTIPPGGTNSAFWGEFVAKRQAN